MKRQSRLFELLPCRAQFWALGRWRRLAALLCVLFAIQLAFALTGKIVDETGKPIEGATITDGKRMTRSNRKGEFANSSSSDSLHISRIGYVAKSVSAKADLSAISLKSVDIVLPTVWVNADPFSTLSPSLGAELIHPDTNARVQDISGLLQQSTSLSSSDIRLTGERQTVSILGGLSRHSLILLDGIPQSDTGEAFDLSKIPVNQIDYIEVIKGNASVYGGSSAIGGIIHIHTKDASLKPTTEAEASGSLGSFGLFSQQYAAAFKYRKLSVSTEYSHYAAKNDFLYDTPAIWNTEPQLRRSHNSKSSGSFFLKTGYLSGRTQLDYSLNTGSFVRQLPGPINFLELYDASSLTGSYMQNRLRAAFDTDHHHVDAVLWHDLDQSIYRNLDSSLPIARSHYGQKQTVQGSRMGYSFDNTERKVTASMELQETRYSFLKPPPHIDSRVKRNNGALALQAQQLWYLGYMQGKSALAVRTDYSDRNLQPSWRLEQEFKLEQASEIAVGGYLGTSFSMPSLFDMYWIGDAQTQGNPALKNESSFGYNLYTSLTNPYLKLKLAWYQNRVQNLIQWRQYYLNGMVWKPFNVGEARISNLELEAQLPINASVSLTGGITYTHALDKSLNSDGSHSPSYDKHLVYTPDLKANIQLAWTRQHYGGRLSYAYTGRQYSTPDNLIKPLAGFDNLDASAYCLFPVKMFDLGLNLKLNNILDRRYYIYAYTPQPGINWTFGLSLTYKTK